MIAQITKQLLCVKELPKCLDFIHLVALEALNIRTQFVDCNSTRWPSISLRNKNGGQTHQSFDSIWLSEAFSGCPSCELALSSNEPWIFRLLVSLSGAQVVGHGVMDRVQACGACSPMFHPRDILMLFLSSSGLMVRSNIIPDGLQG